MSIATDMATRIGGSSSNQFERLIKQAAGARLTAVNMNGEETLYLFSDSSTLTTSPEFDNGFRVGAPQGYTPPAVAVPAPEEPKKVAPKGAKKTPFVPVSSE